MNSFVSRSNNGLLKYAFNKYFNSDAGINFFEYLIIRRKRFSSKNTVIWKNNLQIALENVYKVIKVEVFDFEILSQVRMPQVLQWCVVLKFIFYFLSSQDVYMISIRISAPIFVENFTPLVLFTTY